MLEGEQFAHSYLTAVAATAAEMAYFRERRTQPDYPVFRAQG